MSSTYTNQTNQPPTSVASTDDENSSCEQPQGISVSVVIPIFDEAESLEELVAKIFAALLDWQIEVIAVDDGSRDNTWEIIANLALKYGARFQGHRHRSNFGKAEALSTGFSHATGDFIVTIDADLQDDPSEIPVLLERLEEGYDLVSGWKQRRKDPLSKTVPSRFFNFAARVISGIGLHDFNCGLKAYRREALADLNLYGELHRFIPILVHAEGFRVAEIPVRHFPRQHGRSKYGWKRLFKGFLDLITVLLLTRYLKRPGHFFGGIGLAIGSVGFAILGYFSVMKLLFNYGIGPRPLFFLGLLAVLFGAQMISTGIIGEFLLRLRGPDSKRVTHEVESTRSHLADRN